MLSLEVARILGEETRIRVIGLVMIDSVCPFSNAYRSRGRVRPSFQATTSEAMKTSVTQCFDSARDMILSWQRPAHFDAPTAVLIRATDDMTLDNAPDGVPAIRDDDRKLGWSEYETLRIASVISAPGDHFSIFKEDRVGSATRVLYTIRVTNQR